jgi:hypothetical protein
MVKSEDVKLSIFSSDKDLHEQRKLFSECFPENNGTSVESKEHYFWKFHSLLKKPSSFEFIAKIDTSVVGYYAAIPYEYIIEGKNYTIGMVCDVMTGVKARGKGIFTKLGTYSTSLLKKKELAFTMGYPIREEVMPGHLKVGWDIIFKLPLYMSFIKVNGVFKKIKIEWLSFIPNFILFLLNRFLFTKKINLPFTYDIYSSTQIEDIDGLFDFIKKYTTEKTIVLNKSKEFLKWRLSAPSKIYKLITIKDDKSIIGVAIVTIVIQNDIKSVAVLDFMILNDSKKYAKLLNSVIIEFAQKNRVEIILKMMSKYEKKKLRFINMGYVASPYKFTLIIKKFDDSINKNILFDEKNWCLSWIDSDVF